jgi:hypothetical protein
MHAMLLSPLGLFHVFFPFDFVFCAEPQGSLPNGANGNNLGQPRRLASVLSNLLLTSFVSAGQRPFFRLSSQKKTEGNVMINDHARLREGIAYSDSVFRLLLGALR